MPPGGQSVYSELAIETGMMLRLAFHLALRQTEGLTASIFSLLGVSLNVPDYSTLSRRARKMTSVSKGTPPANSTVDGSGVSRGRLLCQFCGVGHRG